MSEGRRHWGSHSYLHFMDMETELQEIKQLPVLALVAEPKFSSFLIHSKPVFPPCSIAFHIICSH